MSKSRSWVVADAGLSSKPEGLIKGFGACHLHESIETHKTGRILPGWCDSECVLHALPMSLRIPEFPAFVARPPDSTTELGTPRLQLSVC
ncbi:uncharacterized protein PGTG_21666 [Puccinia graminis f. sp. tritici CRL 75-36-700-3]|uniref:Uncharacterized protein n=1 Tax=Puccinia graminis f. sp. tritici (strain CRL 75-36-700-3 / race SCCL) TaxID=418459 RepID=H6QSC9_PUCGT|nr:uncharacterized protein PGTG_21666 [Puccinia graminis f. sp. tritici CRL 75-36-700-3]EHS63657.1 hypothetical protein PGTG_21666 [Puccinia graminis f. sp. tritici CRL 75-36-700-3]